MEHIELFRQAAKAVLPMVIDNRYKSQANSNELGYIKSVHHYFETGSDVQIALIAEIVLSYSALYPNNLRYSPTDLVISREKSELYFLLQKADIQSS